MKIVIGNDHAGVEFKNKIMKALRSKGHEIINVGTDTLDSVDYPDIAKEVSKKIINKEANFGILICGTGIGISIAANKIMEFVLLFVTMNIRQDFQDFIMMRI